MMPITECVAIGIAGRFGLFRISCLEVNSVADGFIK